MSQIILNRYRSQPVECVYSMHMYSNTASEYSNFMPYNIHKFNLLL